jgi:hypothetical protein
MSSWLDLLPSKERAKIRQRLRSPAEYEKLREKVKGPEDLKEEMKDNAVVAELKFALETEPSLKQALKEKIEQDIAERGLDAVAEGEIEGKFDVAMEPHPQTNQEQVVLFPEGNVSEKVFLTKAANEEYCSQFSKGL